MKQELIITAKTVELALSEAARRTGLAEDKLAYTIIETEKSGFLGIGTQEAKIRVEYNRDGGEVAKEFMETLLSDIGLEANVEMIQQKRSDRMLVVSGENAGVLIGHHGDTLDALQHLTNLAANKREEDESRDYVHITVDIENYREKREDALRTLARRMAAKALKIGKSVMLEPMTPYERRIIHSEVQGIEGVSTNSIGVDANRRVVIYLESQGFSIPDNAAKFERPAEKTEHRRKKQQRPATATAKPSKKSRSDDGEKFSTEELSELISTYGSKEKTVREQPQKYKSLDDYLNSLLK